MLPIVRMDSSRPHGSETRLVRCGRTVCEASGR
jgi:hypothetical protein